VNTEIVGTGGVRIGLRVEGAANARPIVFVHGWAQSAGAWAPQLADPALSGPFRLVAMDLRGHGASDVPAGGYDDPVNWADDLAAVLEFAGGDAVVVGWSYGGLVIADYLRVHGTERLSGIVVAGAITEIGRGRPGGGDGPVMRAAIPAVLADDPRVAVPALVDFIEAMAVKPVPGAYVQALLGASLCVPPSVRGALLRRDVDSADVLAAVNVPVLVMHGAEDLVVDKRAAEYAAGKIPGARTRWLEGVGHLPFAEAPAEFNRALGEFAVEVTG
jgi:pimeloyl-ACP methyl ester carboxylesterase